MQPWRWDRPWSTLSLTSWPSQCSLAGTRTRLTSLPWPLTDSEMFQFVNVCRRFPFTRIGLGTAHRFEKFGDASAGGGLDGSDSRQVLQLGLRGLQRSLLRLKCSTPWTKPSMAFFFPGSRCSLTLGPKSGKSACWPGRQSHKCLCLEPCVPRLRACLY